MPSEPLPRERPAAPGRSPSAAWLLPIVALALALRIPTLRVPLDQDAGVYTYAADRWLEGGLPYRDAWDHKPPLVYLVYAGLRALGPSSGAVAWSMWLRGASAVCDAATLVLVFAVGSRLFGRAAALWAAALWGVFVAGPVLQFEAFQPEHVMVLFVTGAVLTALAYARSGKLRHAALCGVLFGVGLAAKQTAAPLGVLLWAWLTWEAWRQEGRGAVGRIATHSALLVAGVAGPWLLFAAYFRWRGAFAEFWSCTYLYNVRYAQEDRAAGSVVAGAGALLRSVAPLHAFLWVAAAAGLVATAARGRWRSAILTGGWAACAFFSCVIPGQASPYYFIQTLMPLSLAGGVTLAGLAGAVRRGPVLDVRNVLAALLLLGLLAVALRREVANYRAAVDPQSGNAVAVRIGHYLGERTEPGERLYVWGSRPQVYVAADRKSTSRFLYNFSYNQDLREAYHFRQDALEAILAGLRRHEPPYIVATETETLAGFPGLAALLARHYTLESDDGFRHEWPTHDKFIPLVRVYRRRAQPGPVPEAPGAAGTGR